MFYAMIGEYQLELTKHQLDELSYSLELGFKKIDRIGNKPAFHSINEYSESIDIKATLIMQKQSVLDEFIDTAKEKKPLFMVMGYGKVIGNVLVQSIQVASKDFVRDGKAIRRDVSVSLTRYYDE
jgi:phage protein U